MKRYWLKEEALIDIKEENSIRGSKRKKTEKYTWYATIATMRSSTNRSGRRENARAAKTERFVDYL